MDSHHEQVMRARQAVVGSKTRTYFAYSTILDRSAFEEWRAQHGYEFFDLPEGKRAVAQDVTLVFDFPSRWWGGRVAGLKDAPGSVVHGLVFEVSEQDWPILQHKEGAVTGMCVERSVEVEIGGKRLKAVAFTTKPERRSVDGPVSTRFVEALVRGAESAGLPGDYVEKLKGSAVE